MLSLKNRLTEGKDFEAVVKMGHFFSFSQIILKVRENKLKEARFGFSIGLKFSKSAVTRNRIKRQLREVIRADLGRIKKGLDIVIIAKNTPKKEISYKGLQEMVREALKKGKLID